MNHWKGTQAPLLATGYKVSWKRVQVCKQKVCSLEFDLEKGIKHLSPKRKEVIYSTPKPENER